MPTLYDTRTLMAVGQALDAPPSFLLDTFFRTEFNFDTEKVDVDLIDRSKRLAMFVQRGNAADVRASRGYTTRSYTPPQIVELQRIDPSKPLKRPPGARPSGEMSAGERYDANVSDAMDENRALIKRREEWMAADALVNSQITVSGENVSAETISFGRAGGQSVTLSGDFRWGQATPAIVPNLQAWMTQTSALSGSTPTDVVMGATAADAFLTDDDVKARLDNRSAIGAVMNMGPQDAETGAFLGVMGGLRFWMYTAEYTDDDGNAQKFIPSNSLIMTGPGLEGTRAYGAIEDPGSGFVAVDVFDSMYTSDNPPGTFVMSRSAPLVIPVRPNASLKAIVTA